jgi:hypothetical protein
VILRENPTTPLSLSREEAPSSSLQRGGHISTVILTKHNILQAFLHFGDVGYLYYETGFTFGLVQFKLADSYA